MIDRPLSVLALTRYAELGASSRVRIYDWAAPLAAHGISITPKPLLTNRYLQDLYAGRRTDRLVIAWSYLRRLYHLSRARSFDVIWIEKELFPWLPGVEWLASATGRPIVIDIDDAVFHAYDMSEKPIVRRTLGRKFAPIFSRASLVLAGNSYLACKARADGAGRVEILPTVVDTERYRPLTAQGATERPFTIGWIGSPSTESYLLPIVPALNRFCAKTGARVVLVGARATRADELQAEVRPWSEGTEVGDIQSFDVGIMPLPDDPWARGKCAYKLIQYMACGLPVVASPVGANVDVVTDEVGLFASTDREWEEALERLSSDVNLRRAMGMAGRRRVEREYSRAARGPQLARLFRDVAAARP